MKRTGNVFLIMLILLGISLQAEAAPELILDTLPAQPSGGTALLNLSLAGGIEPYAGLNAKILFPKGITLTGISQGERLASGNFVLDYRTFSDDENEYATLIAYSASDTFETEGVLLILSLRISEEVSPGTYPINFADTNPNPLVNSKYALSNADGTASLTPAVSAGSITIESKDTDGDGLLDSWEQQLIDADPDDDLKTIEDIRPEDDFDGDGDTNLAKYDNGTSATNGDDFTINPDDKDRDGLSDEWELRLVYSDLEDNITGIEDIRPEDDFDGDGESNLTEYQNQTDPTDPTDFNANAESGDLNGDKKVDIADVIIALKGICGLDLKTERIVLSSEVNDDGLVGLAEAVFILRKLAGMR